jgi:TBC1 domain family member 23 C-terminal
LSNFIKIFVLKPSTKTEFSCAFGGSLLVVSETDIYNFRPSTDQPEMASLVSQHDLMDVLKIVCRRKIPELITIKYGGMEGPNVVVQDIER